MIELKDVTKTYKMGDETIYALNKVSLNIDKGDFLAIVGPSGSGKSTLANIIGGLDKPDSGDVIVDDEHLIKAKDNVLSHYRNKKIGFVFQTFNLQPTYTALENVMLPLIFARIPHAKRVERAKACLKAVGLDNRMNHKPTELSGGQRQRVSIARALANEPEIIIADEPTGNLDSQKGIEIIDLLKDLNKKLGVTLIIITHDTSVARQAKKTITIHDGKIS
ncbi:MAG: ABC transporter ATP-binding protein [Candidatus Wolfebacteria bacterium]|nr:ABC transporter ATP-binding protein [Candidatus Wolfebacteria bacterium]